jgi:hypothetical protein
MSVTNTKKPWTTPPTHQDVGRLCLAGAANRIDDGPIELLRFTSLARPLTTTWLRNVVGVAPQMPDEGSCRGLQSERLHQGIWRARGC